MSPTSKWLGLATVWLIVSVIAVLNPLAAIVWMGLGAVFGGLLLIDGLLLLAYAPMKVERRLPGRFALGEAGEVRLILKNSGKWIAKVEIFDGVPQGATATGMPWGGVIPVGGEARIFHPVRLFERGEKVFGPVHVRRTSPIGFWARKTYHLEPQTVRVYPNYEPVIRFALLAMANRENPLGIVHRSLAGTSREFHQLRDYRDGDPLSQIDWKATSRRQILISRDFQEQRNQSVVFLLDTGRRMRAMDGDLPQFDHALNAILLVSHIALKQGDQVAVKSFGGTERWLPPVKGAHAMPVLLNHLYDYQTTAAPSDFAGAVEQLMARQRRRSLVIVMTNLRGEDGKELVPAMQVLKTKHLVLLASLKERSISDSVESPVESFADALKYLAAGRYMSEREEILRELGALGVLSLDSTAQNFAVALANRYLDIKAAGRL
ncbi:DUF58 domain-containing protein [Luteolibacter pohnpeiensis]|uniref:DUF58 domain-containing protein n=1 Tax=Luteolibacter pohnpeiensis TaxID=454153 RepID=A0A934S9N0_9BACT|nr:DUF58 domain-containing protein [Luteolibacter pohnpeiensis]MBK1882192.1 DUF58 domain-containing protein [Luteolibacter pohnpeiensis]